MKSIIWVGMLASFLTLGFASPSSAIDQVVVESKTFGIGQSTCSVGVYLENTMAITGLVLPLETRTLTNGVYFKSNPLSRPNAQLGRRLDLSPLGSADPGGAWPAASVTPNRFPTPGGNNCSTLPTRTYRTPGAGIDFISPDGFMHATVSTGSQDQGEQIALLPGSDPRRTDSASWVFIFDMDSVVGCFEIDTVCVNISGHLSWVDMNTNEITPKFTKGVICVSDCICDCHANPAACSDPAVNILDVLYTVNVAFRGFAEIDDNNPLCHVTATDVNCDGVSSVIDVIKMVDVAFRAGDPGAVFCDPCE